jgi:hypothetical protein
VRYIGPKMPWWWVLAGLRGRVSTDDNIRPTRSDDEDGDYAAGGSALAPLAEWHSSPT